MGLTGVQPCRLLVGLMIVNMGPDADRILRICSEVVDWEGVMKEDETPDAPETVRESARGRSDDGPATDEADDAGKGTDRRDELAEPGGGVGGTTKLFGREPADAEERGGETLLESPEPAELDFSFEAADPPPSARACSSSSASTPDPS